MPRPITNRYAWLSAREAAGDPLTGAEWDELQDLRAEHDEPEDDYDEESEP